MNEQLQKATEALEQAIDSMPERVAAHASRHLQQWQSLARCWGSPPFEVKRESGLLRALGLVAEGAQALLGVFGLGAVDSDRSALRKSLREVFDEDWYLSRYPDVRSSKMGGWEHFRKFGFEEHRNPNAFFDSDWYLTSNPDVASTGVVPIEHYMLFGAKELRDPHPDFDANWYVTEHPSASQNPLAFHLKEGLEHNRPTRRAPKSELATGHTSVQFHPRGSSTVSVVVPVYRGLDETRRCLLSVLADPLRPPGDIIVINDLSPDFELQAWLEDLASADAIRLCRSEVNLGFVASVNLGMTMAGMSDVVLLNSDTEVPPGWLLRLQRHAQSDDHIGTITPFSNNATICSYPDPRGGDLTDRFSFDQIDFAAQEANSGKHVVIPTAVGFAMYIRRECLDEVGLFDVQTFGRGYGEENDFSLRAIQLGWKNVLACDTYVYHKGEVSFGQNSPLRERAFDILKQKYPDYVRALTEFSSRNPAQIYRFSLSAALLKHLRKPVILIITHDLGGGTERHVRELISCCSPDAEFLVLRSTLGGCELSIPGIPGSDVMRFSKHETSRLAELLKLFPLSRIHIHHIVNFSFDVAWLIRYLDVSFDFTVHDYLTVCPRVNMVTPHNWMFCAEAPEAECNSCIATDPTPIAKAKNIFEYRWRNRWLITEADRVFCPSNDVVRRLERFGLKGNLLLVPHERDHARRSHRLPTVMKSGTLRVALLGFLTSHKGLNLVRDVVFAAREQNIEFVLIGETDPHVKWPRWAKFRETGEYKESDLPNLLQDVAPDVFWFPAVWPETYSYTLSAALESNKPIVASSLGAFEERLRDSFWHRLISPGSEPAAWLEAFGAARHADNEQQSSRVGASDAIQ